ncbi:hypothetical protein [Serratia fonticola]|uniref:Uncharacterized protein n=1 Tax=Serratia fonticola TaxID=47917 RepID=A0AAW3WJT7_SERFO|nr:hypothetical protein [Serratia fonticola]MBC3210690.1 hypothetical protein [Serratia fonticola]NYA11672.1 hypothetical protein [Serratia fonticola]NYA32766.1 hypothetical protein [Serratia fonticola]
MSRKPRKKEEDCCQNPDAKSHRTRNRLYERVGFYEKKVSLGQDVLEKLEFLIRLQHGENPDEPMVVSDVLSYCINTCYNINAVQATMTKQDKPKVKAAKTPEGQRLYRYYQMAQVGGASKLVEAFNAKNMRGKPYFPHTNDVIKNLELEDLYSDENFWEGDDGPEEEEDEDQWSITEIRALNDHEAVSQAIKELNERAFPTTKKKRSKTILSSGRDTKDRD